jgi:hypothetical protein
MGSMGIPKFVSRSYSDITISLFFLLSAWITIVSCGGRRRDKLTPEAHIFNSFCISDQLEMIIITVPQFNIFRLSYQWIHIRPKFQLKIPDIFIVSPD